MKKYEVTNQGRRKRTRLGVTFEPNEPVEMKVSARQRIVLKAVKDFDVKEVGGEENPSASDDVYPEDDHPDDDSHEFENGNEFTDEYIQEIQDKNIADFKAEVEANDIPIQRAIEIEQEGKNRSTLIEELNALESGE